MRAEALPAPTTTTRPAGGGQRGGHHPHRVGRGHGAVEKVAEAPPLPAGFVVGPGAHAAEETPPDVGAQRAAAPRAGRCGGGEQIRGMDLPLFLIFLAACAAAATTGILFRPGGWYAALSKPRWTPPDRLFPVAWTLLYLAMAAAAARVAALDGPPLAFALWALQIALNTLWTPVFFGLGRMRDGLWVIGALWLAVLATTIAFWRVDALAGWLFLPYLGWITYAAALNAAVWRRNPEAQPRRLT